MWWIPITIVGGYLLKKILDKSKNKNIPKNPVLSGNNWSILEKNFINLKNNLENANRCFKFLIIGQPGAGKSSLIIKLTNKKCKPLPSIGQTTDATNWSEKLINNFFIKFNNYWFVDTPGYNTKKHPTLSYIKYFPFSEFENIIYVIKDKIHISDIQIFQKLSNIGKNIIFIRCFEESLSKKDKIILEEDYKKHFKNFNKVQYLGFVSNRTLTGISELRNYIELNVN